MPAMAKRARRPIIPKNAIISIHNYCDKWCERCAFTSRCSVFAAAEADRREPRTRDLSNQEFWDEMSSCLVDTLEMVRERCRELGIDPDEPPSEEYWAEEARVEEAVREHPLSAAAMDYCVRVSEWFKSSEKLLKAKEDEINLKARLQLPNARDPKAEASELTDLLEVVMWYHTVIVSKVRRAVFGTVRGVPECIADLPKDSDGSAKIALISIDRSMAAWTKLRAHFPEDRDALLDFLVRLDRLRRGIEKEFPKARAFVRPGFDQ
jgi:hypothetical protein